MLVRLNEQLDADARAAISDAERYLLEPTVLTAGNKTNSSYRGLKLAGNTNASTTATTRVIQSLPNSGPAERRMMEATGGSKHDNESDLRQHVGVGARRVGCQGRLYRNSKCEREISGGVVNLAQESPTLRLSERGQEAARTSGEREFRSRQRETDDSFESIDSSGVQVHTEQRVRKNFKDQD